MEKTKGRHELKHYINFGDVMELRSRLPCIARPDKNADEENGYRVKSLYFDNYDDKVLREKMDGVNGREKFRLRLYNEDPSYIRLEKKSKKNSICFKESALVTKEECKQLLEGKFSALKDNGHPLCLELYTKMYYQQLRPKNIVDYRREAFIYSMGNVRITLDYNICTSNNVYGFLNAEDPLIPVSGTYILEVKYDNFLPEIIRGMVSLSSRKTTAFSKYAVTRSI